jgi:hypothetical protein
MVCWRGLALAVLAQVGALAAYYFCVFPLAVVALLLLRQRALFVRVGDAVAASYFSAIAVSAPSRSPSPSRARS